MDEQLIKTLEDKAYKCVLYGDDNGRELYEATISLIKRRGVTIKKLKEVLATMCDFCSKRIQPNTYKINFEVGTEVYAILDREEFPRGVYKCEVSAYLIDCDSKLYSLLTVTNGKNTVVGMQTDIENMYATRAEAEAAMNKEAEI